MFTATPSIVSKLNNDDPLTILIAEADPGLRSALRTLFEQEGHFVEEMTNGLEVVEASQRIEPDIIWLDVKLSQLDGITACRRIRAQSPGERIPIIMLAALPDDDGARQAYEAGATDYVTKPLSPAALRFKVRHLVNLARAETALHFTDVLLTNLINSLDDAFVLFDAALQIQVFNPAAERIFGYRATEILGHNIRCLAPDVARLQQVDWIAALVSGQQSFAVSEHYQEVGRHKDGRAIPLEISPGRIEAKNGSLFAFVAQDISRRRQTEEALLREKNFSDAIINSLPGIFYVWDEQGRLVRRNKNHELALGYSARDFEQLRLLDLIAPEDRDFISRKLEEVHTGLESQGDAQLLTRSGEKLPYRLTGSSVYIQDKTYLMGVGIDISQQKKAENEIRQRTAQLEALRQTSLEIVAELNLNSLLHSIVARAKDLLMGTSGGLFLYRSEQDALEWTIDVGALQMRGNLIRQGEGLAGRVWKTGQPLVIADYQHWEGQADFLENSTVAAAVGAPLRWRDEFLGVLVVASDVAQSFSASDAELLSMFATQAAIALQNAHLFEESQRRAQELFVLNDIGQLLTSTFDLDTVLNRAIDSVRVLLAAKAASIFLHEPASTSNPEPALVIAAAAGPNSEKLQGLRLPATAGIVGWVMQEKQPVLVNQADQDPRFDPQIDALTQVTAQSVIAAPLLAKNTVFGVIEVLNQETGSFNPRDLELLSTVAGSAAIAIENAGLYQAEREQYRRLQQSQAQLIQAEKMTALGRLAATLAHEINNPLQAITSDLELILDFPLDKAEQLARLRVVRQEIDRLSEMTRSVLTFSRPSLAPRRIVPVTDLIKQTLGLARKKLQHSHIQVTTHWQVEPLVRAAPDQLVQVFLNVIINAIEAIYDHGQIHISVEAKDEQAIIRLSNDGPPIASEDLARIFEPFFTTKAGGTGLGLAVSHNIITQHGGTLNAENMPDARGAAFTVRLPLASRYQEAEVKT
jgi:hypothetical protein